MTNNNVETEQEKFWQGEFGSEYIGRNPKEQLMPGRIALFTKVLARTRGVESVIEFGSNIGSNLRAIRPLLPDAELSAIEINTGAVAELNKWGEVKVYPQSILDFSPDYQRDLTFTSGVLIHINPKALPRVYDLLHQTSRRYIMVAEYYNTTPVELEYRGHQGKLFKRDFAGEILERFDDLHLVDYGFVWRRDPNFLLGDITWFLMQKGS